MILFKCSDEIKISGFIAIRKEVIVKALNLSGDIYFSGIDDDIKDFFTSIYKLEKGNWIVEIDEPFFVSRRNKLTKLSYKRRKNRIILSVTKSKITINTYGKIFDRYCNRAKRTPKHILFIEETDINGSRKN